MKTQSHPFDIFLSHASEDKVDFVRPLVNKLIDTGIRVWYDENSIELGDSIRESIDKGLNQSEFAVVVLSPSYFKKNWTNSELNGYFLFDELNSRRILPIWYNVGFEEVKAYSPILADRKAISSTGDLDTVVREIADFISIKRDSDQHTERLEELKSSSPRLSNYSKVFVKDKNIYGVQRNGKVTQLTFEESDSKPLLFKNKDKVAFLREEQVWYWRSRKRQEYLRYKIMVVDASTLEETVLADQKPFQDGRDGSFELLSPKNLMISPDESKVLFVIEKSATGSEFVEVDIETGSFKELFSAEKVEIIKSGKYKDLLLIGVSEVGERGRDVYYKVSDWKGNNIISFSDRDEYMVFRSSALEGDNQR